MERRFLFDSRRFRPCDDERFCCLISLGFSWLCISRKDCARDKDLRRLVATLVASPPEAATVAFVEAPSNCLRDPARDSDPRRLFTITSPVADTIVVVSFNCRCDPERDNDFLRLGFLTSTSVALFDAAFDGTCSCRKDSARENDFRRVRSLVMIGPPCHVP